MSGVQYTCMPVNGDKLPSIKLKRTTLSDGVYSSLHDAIITLRLEPGQMVYETELANSLGVSRTPVREAFRLLLSEELIEIMPQRGARIAYISRRKVEDVRFVRMSLEMSAFGVVASKWNPDDTHFKELEVELEALLQRQSVCSANNDNAGFLEADELYHRRILEQTENATLMNVISSMRAHLNRVRYLELIESHHSAVMVEQHRRVLQAIVANRVDDAAALLKEHLEYLQYDFPYLIKTYASYFRE